MTESDAVHYDAFRSGRCQKPTCDGSHSPKGLSAWSKSTLASAEESSRYDEA